MEKHFSFGNSPLAKGAVCVFVLFLLASAVFPLCAWDDPCCPLEKEFSAGMNPHFLLTIR